MSVILVMIPAALVLAGMGVLAFVIAAKRGQFDDLDTPAIRAVFDDDDFKLLSADTSVCNDSDETES